MSVTLVIEVAVVDLHDRAADVAGFRIPGDVIADFQSAGHVWLLHFKRAPIVAAARCPEAESERVEDGRRVRRSEEHTSELQSLMRISYAVFCLKKKKKTKVTIKCSK